MRRLDYSDDVMSQALVTLLQSLCTLIHYEVRVRSQGKGSFVVRA